MPIKKLLVELSPKTDKVLTDLAGKSDFNKSTIVNRAIQVYGIVQQFQECGHEFTIEVDGNTWTLVPL